MSLCLPRVPLFGECSSECHWGVGVCACMYVWTYMCPCYGQQRALLGCGLTPQGSGVIREGLRIGPRGSCLAGPPAPGLSLCPLHTDNHGEGAQTSGSKVVPSREDPRARLQQGCPQPQHAAPWPCGVGKTPVAMATRCSCPVTSQSQGSVSVTGSSQCSCDPRRAGCPFSSLLFLVFPRPQI